MGNKDDNMPVIVQGSRIYNLYGNVTVQVLPVTPAPTAEVPPLPPLPSMPRGFSNFIPQFTEDSSIGGEESKEPSQDFIANDAIEEGLGDLGMANGSSKEEE